MNLPVRVVLVETSHPGNIGAAARAMKTMGLTQLALVKPRHYPSAEASARASGADDLLVRARVCATLPEALDGMRAGDRCQRPPARLALAIDRPRECGRRVVEAASRGEVGLVFGREQSGLTNEELQRCNLLVQIPANPEYSSLNLAMAVQVDRLRDPGGGRWRSRAAGRPRGAPRAGRGARAVLRASAAGTDPGGLPEPAEPAPADAAPASSVQPRRA